MLDDVVRRKPYPEVCKACQISDSAVQLVPQPVFDEEQVGSQMTVIQLERSRQNPLMMEPTAEAERCRRQGEGVEPHTPRRVSPSLVGGDGDHHHRRASCIARHAGLEPRRVGLTDEPWGEGAAGGLEPRPGAAGHAERRTLPSSY